MMAESNVCIVGSMNMDLVVTTETMPQQGETVMGKDFSKNPGGKGANQAVAASRMGANVHFIGAVGDDTFGQTLLDNLTNEGIQTGGVEIIPEAATGTATIILSNQDNRIIVAPGANNGVTPELVERHRRLIAGSDVVLLQLEVPMETVVFSVEEAAKSGVPVILNPAPYQRLPDSVLQGVRWLTPNELEATELANDAPDETVREKWIVTRGAHGATFMENGQEKPVDGYTMKVNDTTGAGDTFNGALASALGVDASIDRAIQMANAAAALSVTKTGAQHGMPTKRQTEIFLQENH
ncbi:ribokinase [Lentibacillus halophilus]|uniref:Ribokinase n=1 Tax=Lentibacillus halophilus TaxID=295065 RepID=A0ABP3JAV2_9BACI